MKLSIIIVHYNTPELLRKCLKSIYAQNCKFQFEVLVIDNSARNFRELLTDFPWVKFTRNRKNIGFAKGNNQGLKMSSGEFVFFLNPDTEVRANLLNGMLSFMESDKGIGILGPKLVFPDGSLQLSCRKFYTVRSILTRRVAFLKVIFGSQPERDHLMLENDHKKKIDVDWLLGASMMARRDVLIRLRGFDEFYALYFEDVDLCYRVKKMGLRVVYNPDFTIVHHHRRESAKSFTSKTIRHILSALRFFFKYGFPF